ncbi:unnamed protein product [Scytosiphon promiscuus]
MDETALSASILQFVGGQGLPVPASQTVHTVSVPAHGALHPPASDPIVQPSSGGDITGSDVASGGTAGAGSTAASSQQQRGLVRTLMGNKLGNFNMRGMEAGMAMCNVTKKKPGKLLSTRDRRLRRKEQSSPYGNGSSSRGKRKNATGSTSSDGGKAGADVADSRDVRKGETLSSIPTPTG